MNPADLLSVLPENHVLHTFMVEHQIILGYLRDLVGHRGTVIESPDGDLASVLASIGDLGEQLISAESHHQREELVLFPELERLGISGPTQAMVQEHEWLRPAKVAIVDLAAGGQDMPRDLLVTELDAKVSYLASLLESHISRENQVLYPMALQVIHGVEEWDRLKAACDELGYCPFTPLG